MTINPTLRAKVIELYLQKRGRNEIASSLRISQGSVSNILRAYKSKSESTTSLGQNCDHISNGHTTCTEDISTESQTIDSLKVTPQEIESFISNNNASISTGVNINNTGSPLLMTCHGSGTGQAVTTTNNSNPNVVTPRNGAPLSHLLGEDTSTDEEVIPSVTSYSNPPSLEQERIAWDYYGPAWMGILKQIRREKDQRRHELLVIDRRKQKLSDWRKRLEQMQYDLTAREAWILESESFLPLARQLQEMKLALEDALPWIETILEKAEAENVDIRTAAINVAQELRLYRQSGGIQKQIERANQELALVNMATIQKQQALTVLIDLLNRGVTESQIVQLINFAGEWNKYWQSSTTNGNLQQPVNVSNNPGISSGNGYDGNFSVNDLIRLNLLKSTTTNLLKSARTPPGL